MNRAVEPWIFILAIMKGIAMAAIIVGLAETGFLESLAIAVCSALVTGSFLLVSTHIQARQTGRKVEQVQAKVDTVAAKVETVAEGVESGNGNHKTT